MRWLALVLTIVIPHTAHAFCGFYVAGSGQQLVNDATQVVLMRKGTRTVLAMENNYQGPAEAFAMVVPVPVVLHEADVKTLPKQVFEHVEQMGAPRLVEYWEQDPCVPDRPDEGKMGSPRGGRAYSATAIATKEDLGVTIEAKFAVGEYQILILSAKDSTGLETWLHDNKYNVPPGAEALLRPYVESGSKFFVAKVDPQKVKFVEGHAVLSPLRFHYDADELALPIRLGMANSAGAQDLIINILAPGQRYQVANYPNVTIPTNLDVKNDVKDRFAAFYAALFDATLAQHPGAVVTEYAWQATTCDPCPGPQLDGNDFALLGADVLDQPAAAAGSAAPVPRYQGRSYYDFVLTRLHARYGKDLKDDLVFKQAGPIVGGREHVIADGKLETGAQPAQINNFQARYAIRHEWDGPITCASPHRHRWGGPPDDRPTTHPALDLAHAPRSGVALAASVIGGVPELGLAGAAPPDTKPPTAPATAPVAKAKSGCGCNSNDPSGLAIVALIIGLVFRRPDRARRRQ